MKKDLINVVTLGCSKNLVDSEHLMAQLQANGFLTLHDSNSTKAKTIIVNTCGFIGDAKQESVDMILQYAMAKKDGLIDRLYVFGCLSQRYGNDLAAEVEEVDKFFGVDDMKGIVEILGGKYDESLAQERVVTTEPHYAYLKISEGCNRGCSYCAIPMIRGKHKSVPIEELVAETRLLAAKGVKELIVIAQDTTYYGLDLYGERRLAQLLNELCEVEGIEWIRLHYAYPAQYPDDVIAVMRDQPKICKYLDIPLQHISDSQLKSMRRGVDRQQTIDLIEKLRHAIPDIALRTTLLVGYPNESEADFEELLRFVADVKFDRLGVFPYSEEEDTYSAMELDDNIPDYVKEQRVDRIMEMQSEISLQNNLRRIGHTDRVVIDRKEGDFYVGRTQYDSPEVDQEVLVLTGKRLRVGNFYDVRITDGQEYDLYAELIV